MDLRTHTGNIVIDNTECLGLQKIIRRLTSRIDLTEGLYIK